jgi:hypothetical protein
MCCCCCSDPVNAGPNAEVVPSKHHFGRLGVTTCWADRAARARPAPASPLFWSGWWARRFLLDAGSKGSKAGSSAEGGDGRWLAAAELTGVVGRAPSLLRGQQP